MDRFAITPLGMHYHFLSKDNLYVHEFTIITSTARGVITVLTRLDGNDRNGGNQSIYAIPTTPVPSTTDATQFTPAEKARARTSRTLHLVLHHPSDYYHRASINSGTY